jgi:hypothetical protein
MILPMSEYEWATRPPNTIERIIAGVFVAVLLLASASSYAGWRVFGQYDGTVAAGSVIVGLVLMRFLPTVKRKPPA